MAQIMYNNEQVYLINVPGKRGYSFAIATNYDPITSAMDLDLFDDMTDAEYCNVEEMTQEDWKFWEKYVVAF